MPLGAITLLRKRGTTLFLDVGVDLPPAKFLNVM